MHDYINAEDYELWDVILDGPYVPLKEVKDEAYHLRGKDQKGVY